MSDPRLDLEDLLVILADKSWKGKCIDALDERIARATGGDANFFDALLSVAGPIERRNFADQNNS